MAYHQQAPISDQLRKTGSQVPEMAAPSTSFGNRTRSDDSWVEISSQPSSSSLSSVADEIVTTGLRVQHDPRYRRRRTLRPGAPERLNLITRVPSTGSSQEEYEESESESDRVMASSGEGLQMGRAQAGAFESEDDENRTTINHPFSSNESAFTPQPNAFSHPPTSANLRQASQPTVVPGSYFPHTSSASQRPSTARAPIRGSTATSSNHRSAPTPSHMPQNILSPAYNAAAHHDEALRASLSTLLSCAAAARSLAPSDTTKQQRRSATAGTAQRPTPGGNRVEPLSLRLVPESALHSPSRHLQEPTFRPTLRPRASSTSTTSTNPSSRAQHERATANSKEKRRPASRSASKEHLNRASKKARRSQSSEDLSISPTLLTWVVSAGVVVVLSALSFSAGYSMGREAGLMEAHGAGGGLLGASEAGSVAGDELLRGCAREAGRSSLGLKRSLARSAVV